MKRKTVGASCADMRLPKVRIMKNEQQSLIEGSDIYVGVTSGRQFRFVDGQWYACTSNGTPEEMVDVTIIR